VGEPGRGGAHGAPAMRLEMPPGRRGRSESGSTRAQWWERERSEAEAGPVQGGDGGHDFFSGASLLVYGRVGVRDRIRIE
jgi:hypothetical protein